ncbi:MAG TPA: AraC family transcriptional regulator [Opitutaceae bacterium]|nr:AraC family transcriptional regulator [Opitutaceae bacterium]
MPSNPPDKFKASNAFWYGLKKIGLTPAAVLRQSKLPVTLYDGEKNLVTTEQFFALWRAVGELNPDPAAGLKLAAQIDIQHLPPSSLAAFHACNYRDALTRMARYKQLCSPEEMRVTESKDECVVELAWLYATEEQPTLLTDAAFAGFVELGRRGTQTSVNPKRVELKRAPEPSKAHETYFQCPVKFGAKRNALILRRDDLDRPFVTHNSELLEMLSPGLEKALAGRKARAKISDQVKWILKRLLAGNRPDILAVARELGVSGRTLQRRITDEGASFRQLLLEARQELVRQYLTQSSIEINEAAYLLGYEDPNSFYRAFRTWEGTTPAHWRSAHREESANRN